MEFKIVYLPWADTYAVMNRIGSGGWTYVAKYISKTDAEKLMQEVA